MTRFAKIVTDLNGEAITIGRHLLNIIANFITQVLFTKSYSYNDPGKMYILKYNKLN